MFDETTERFDGTHKELFLQKYARSPISFTGRPILDNLVAALIEVFKVRYDPPPTDAGLQMLEFVRTALREGSDKEDVIKGLRSYRYPQLTDSLHREGWLVKTIRDHLAQPGWPVDDKASRQETKLRSSTLQPPRINETRNIKWWSADLLRAIPMGLR